MLCRFGANPLRTEQLLQNGICRLLIQILFATQDQSDTEPVRIKKTMLSKRALFGVSDEIKSGIANE